MATRRLSRRRRPIVQNEFGVRHQRERAMPAATASTARLTKFYGELSSLEAIMAGLSAAGVDTDRLTARDLYTRDLDCHNLGMHAMLDLLAAVAGEYGQPSADDSVLDLGCGLGGPGRFLVDQYGCSV